ncbi:MAG: VacJ family lipoprotein [Gammaproteobacteria bacterium]|nr:VacJ family lipoprotein [Gammaproteobacteria bacterium]
MNRATFAFNQKFDKIIGRPVAKTYVRAVPRQARDGIHNVLHNLGAPISIINDLLQGQFKYMFKDTGRFNVNSTIGLLGWFDVAQHMDLPHHSADFGETLADYGVSSGPYLVLPFLGPSSVRDTGSLYVDYEYADPIQSSMQPRYRNAATLTNAVDTRAGLLDLDSAIDSAFDPYTFVRDAWIQHRRFQLYRGNPPMQYPDYPDLPPDDSDSNSAPSAVSHTKSAAAGTQVSPAPVKPKQPPAVAGSKEKTLINAGDRQS